MTSCSVNFVRHSLFVISICSFVRGTIQSPVRGHFTPYITMCPRYKTRQQSCSNNTEHPALHNFVTDSNDCRKPGMMWPVVAAFGSIGQSISHSWVERDLFPSGTATVTGFLAARTLVMCALTDRKWSVVPESNIPHPSLCRQRLAECLCLQLLVMTVASSSEASKL